MELDGIKEYKIPGMYEKSFLLCVISKGILCRNNILGPNSLHVHLECWRRTLCRGQALCWYRDKTISQGAGSPASRVFGRLVFVVASGRHDRSVGMLMKLLSV
jgi:hypothetical protein